MLQFTTPSPPSELPSSMREPLAAQTNVNNPQSSLKERALRRTSSQSFVVRSSDAEISPHSSIVDAEYFSSEGSGEILQNITVPQIQIDPLRSHPLTENGAHVPRIWNAQTASIDTVIDSDQRTENQSQNITRFRYGHGTNLSTITEKNSRSTIGTKGSTELSCCLPYHHSDVNFSSSILASHPHLLRRRPFLPNHPTRRFKSHSLDDSQAVRSDYHEALASVLGIQIRSTNILDIGKALVNPHQPLFSPPARPETPPGFPSWNANQVHRAPIPGFNAMQHVGYAVRRKPNRLERSLGINPKTKRITAPLGGPFPQQYVGSRSKHTILQRRQPAPARETIHSGPWGQQRPVGPPRWRPIRTGVAELEDHPFVRRNQQGPQPVHSMRASYAAYQRPHGAVLFKSEDEQPPAEQSTIASVAMPGSKLETAHTSPSCNPTATHCKCRVARAAPQGPPERCPHLVSQNSTTGRIAAKHRKSTSAHVCLRCRVVKLAEEAARAWYDVPSWCSWVLCGLDTEDQIEKWRAREFHTADDTVHRELEPGTTLTGAYLQDR